VCRLYELFTGKDEELEEGDVGRTISEMPPTLHRCFHDQFRLSCLFMLLVWSSMSLASLISRSM